MAEHNDNQRRRMLFTDFDVSDKGRPVSVLTEEPPEEHFAAQSHSIAALAASLGLDFEDDDGAAPPARPETGAAAEADAGGDKAERAAISVHSGLPGDDLELSLEQAGGILIPPPPPRPVAAPTWEEFTNAFRAADPAREEKEGDWGAAGREDDAAASEAVAIDPARPAAEDGDAAAFTAPTAAYDPIPDDDGEVDVLSFLSDPETADTVVMTRGDRQRAVSPPPAVPYGGLERITDWFSPPEEQLPGDVERVADWFEPPEETAPAAQTVAAPAAQTAPAPENAGDLFDTVVLAGGGVRETTQRLNKPREDGMASGESGLDIFSDLDVESVWSDRVGKSPPRSPAAGSSETHTLDLFADVDLESMWKSRQGRRVTSESAKRFAEEAVAAERENARLSPSAQTTVLDKSLLDASDTVLLKQDEFRPAVARDAQRRRVEAEDDDDDDVLMDLDNLNVDFPNASAGGRTDDTDPTDSIPAVDDPGAMDGFDSDGADGDVLPPVLDDSDILEVARDEEPAPEIAAAPEETDASFDAFGAEDIPPVIPIDMEEDAYAGYEADEAPEEEASPAAATISDADFGDEGVNDDVMPPVVGDGDIDLRGTRHGMRQGAAADADPDAIAGEDDIADGTDGGDADVAVNPMDVFANMDDMDFSDDMDDDMRSMMEDGEDATVADIEGANALVDNPMTEEALAAPPDGIPGKIRFYAGRTARRVLPMAFLGRLEQMVAWRENWWFYCDLLAAIIASASLAVIISYYIWFAG